MAQNQTQRPAEGEGVGKGKSEGESYVTTSLPKSKSPPPPSYPRNFIISEARGHGTQHGAKWTLLEVMFDFPVPFIDLILNGDVLTCFITDSFL